MTLGGSCQAGTQPRLGAAGTPAGWRRTGRGGLLRYPPSHEGIRQGGVADQLNSLVRKEDACPSTGISAVRRPGAEVSAHRDFPLSVDTRSDLASPQRCSELDPGFK
jgi:hypothetical protein